MRQRVAFVRTLLAGKPVLALDEPFAALDALTRQEVQGWLVATLADEPRTVVLVTHDVEEAVLLADRVVVMSPRPGRAVLTPGGRAAAAAGPQRRGRRRAAGRGAARAGAGRMTATANDPRAGAGSALRRLLRWLPALLIVAALIAAWQLYATYGSVDSLLLPSPAEVADALWTDRALLWDNFTVTAGEVLLGIAVAAAAALALRRRDPPLPTLRRAIYPLLVASQTVPIPLVASLLVVWLGFDLAPKLAIVGLVSFFPIVVTTLDALAAVDPERERLMRTLGATRLRTFRLVEAPAALPGLFSGAKIAVAVAVIGAVFAEQSGSDAGLGRLVQQAVPQLLTARAWAAVLILSAFAIALFGLLSLVERRVLPWAFETRGGRTR